MGIEGIAGVHEEEGKRERVALLPGLPIVIYSKIPTAMTPVLMLVVRL